jgi:predicted DCC family thiol-disulfide oxidoreductase YuxK
MNGPVILFDGVCNLCNGFVQFVIARDPAGIFRFGPLQSDAARQLIADTRPPASMPDSVVLVENGRVWTQSSAVLRVARRLRFPWWLASVLVAVPRPIREWFYRVVARNRYRWFGKRDRCMVPTPELRARFLDAGRPQDR